MKKIINKKYILKSIITFILFYYSSYLQLIPILILNLNPDKLSGTNKVLLSMYSNIILLIILILLYKNDLKNEFKKFKENLNKNIDTGFKYWLIGLMTMFISNIIINIIIGNGQAENEKIVQQMITYAPYIMVINAGIIAPIIEEITFRKAFKNVFNNKWLFILSSSLIFGSLHVITKLTSPLDLLYIIPYSSLGISLAYMYYKTDTIYTSITMHIFHNTILTILSIL